MPIQFWLFHHIKIHDKKQFVEKPSTSFKTSLFEISFFSLFQSCSTHGTPETSTFSFCVHTHPSVGFIWQIRVSSVRKKIYHTLLFLHKRLEGKWTKKLSLARKWNNIVLWQKSDTIHIPISNNNTFVSGSTREPLASIKPYSHISLFIPVHFITKEWTFVQILKLCYDV